MPRNSSKKGNCVRCDQGCPNQNRSCKEEDSYLHAIKPFTHEDGSYSATSQCYVIWVGGDSFEEGSVRKRERKIHCIVAGNPVIIVLFYPFLLNQKAGIFRRYSVQNTGERLRERDSIHRLIKGKAPMNRHQIR